jgi:hypothetical protein
VADPGARSAAAPSPGHRDRPRAQKNGERTLRRHLGGRDRRHDGVGAIVRRLDPARAPGRVRRLPGPGDRRLVPDRDHRLRRSPGGDDRRDHAVRGGAGDDRSPERIRSNGPIHAQRDLRDGDPDLLRRLRELPARRQHDAAPYRSSAGVAREAGLHRRQHGRPHRRHLPPLHLDRVRGLDLRLSASRRRDHREPLCDLRLHDPVPFLLHLQPRIRRPQHPDGSRLRSDAERGTACTNHGSGDPDGRSAAGLGEADAPSSKRGRPRRLAKRCDPRRRDPGNNAPRDLSFGGRARPAPRRAVGSPAARAGLSGSLSARAFPFGRSVLRPSRARGRSGSPS